MSDALNLNRSGKSVKVGRTPTACTRARTLMRARAHALARLQEAEQAVDFLKIHAWLSSPNGAHHITLGPRTHLELHGMLDEEGRACAACAKPAVYKPVECGNCGAKFHIACHRSMQASAAAGSVICTSCHKPLSGESA